MEDKYIIAGWEYGNFYKLVEFYMTDTRICGFLDTCNEIEKATAFNYDLAEAKREQLQEIYSDYGWYLLRLNPLPNR
jgi:Na+/H+ antiporter NhaB